MNAWNGNGPSPESHTDFRGSLLALENNLLRKRLREVLDGEAGDGWELVVEFTLPGQPLPKERPRVVKGHTYTPDRTLAEETRILDAFNHEAPLWEPTTEDVRLELDFHRTNMRTADLDNLAKSWLDAGNKHIWADDKQVIDLHARRYDGAGNQARTDVRIYIRKG